MQQTKGKSDCFQLLNEREKAVVLVSITFVDIVLFSLFFFFCPLCDFPMQMDEVA